MAKQPHLACMPFSGFEPPYARFVVIIGIMKNATQKQADSLGKKVLMWILTIIGVVLLARLLITLSNLAFNFSDTPIGRRLDEGLSFNFLSDISFKNVVLQLSIIAVVVALFVISRRSKKESSKDHDKK